MMDIAWRAGRPVRKQRSLKGNTPLKTNPSRWLRFALASALAVCLGSAFSARAEDAAPAEKHFDVKNNFRNICGFCHADYGRKAGKGPQLMNSERSDEFMFNRIKKGMPSRMAAFGSVYTDDQIRDIVRFIRNLKEGEEPQNP